MVGCRGAEAPVEPSLLSIPQARWLCVCAGGVGVGYTDHVTVRACDHVVLLL